MQSVIVRTVALRSFVFPSGTIFSVSPFLPDERLVIRSPFQILSFVIAALVCAALASVIQTQINIAEIARLGVKTSMAQNILITAEDMLLFGPIMTGISVVGLLIAFALAASLRKVTAASGFLVFSVFGWIGLWAALKLLGLVTPMSALVSATREWFDLALICLAGTSAALVYSWHARRLARAANTSKKAEWARIACSVLLLSLPAASFAILAPSGTPGVPNVSTTDYVLETIADKLDRPWSVATLPDGRHLVTLMAGKLLSIARDKHVSELELTGFPPVFNRGGSIGFMEVVVDPKFSQNGYLFFTAAYGTKALNGTHVVRAKLVGDKLEAAKVIFTTTAKPGPGNNGGRMAFLPDDTMLLTVGDGSERREEAQNLASHLGKVIRIDREGKAPSDNPFLSNPDAKPEIYSLGHRNPQGIVFDNVTGVAIASEHGARGGDEINLLRPGANYGWPIVTDGIDYSFARISPYHHVNGHSAPLLQWTPSIAPSGLAIYRGNHFPQWQDALLVPALKERAIRVVTRVDGHPKSQFLLLGELDERIRDVKVMDGVIYVITDGEAGRLLKLTAPRPVQEVP
jgi:glucose/arabinose dehydrogenase